jgi:sodium/potassium-transporting ATPase subunit alpha
MEVALVQLAADAMPGLPHSPRLSEIPFDSQRKRLSTVHAAPQGPVLYCKGAPEVVLARCARAAMDGGAVELSADLVVTFRTAAEAMAEKGLRVLAFAWRELPESFELGEAEAEMTLAGLISLEDPPRPEVAAALQKCRDAGIKVIMVTGDHPHTATAIAREIGLVRSASPVVITGERLRHLSDIQLQLALDAPEIVFARVLAEQKMRIVGALKSKRELVAVTGDGVNDAPALRKADVGIAMGRSGTDVAREAADMVLLDDNFASIVAAIEEGRAVFANIRNFLTYILTSNIPELIPYLAFVVFRIPLPLTIIQILAVDLGTDMLPALGLGAEMPAPDIMKAPPRSRADRLLNWPLLARAYLFLGMMQAAAAMSAYWFVLRNGGWHFGEKLAAHDPLYLQATTACLSAIVVMQIANVFLCRSESQPLLARSLVSNKLILAGIATEILLITLIVYTPWVNTLFGTAPIPLVVWLFIVPFALGMLALEELRKWLVRSHPKRPASALIQDPF